MEEAKIEEGKKTKMYKKTIFLFLYYCLIMHFLLNGLVNLDV